MIFIEPEKPEIAKDLFYKKDIHISKN